MPPLPPRPTSFGKMFPKNFLDEADLPVKQMVDVEIVAIELSDYTIKMQKKGQEFNPEWVMWFREFQKPMRFRSAHAKVVASLFGTDDPSEVIGRRISIYWGEYTAYGEKKHGILIHQILPHQGRPHLPAGGAASPGRTTARGSDAFDASNLKPIGPANADKLRQGLAEQGLTFDGLLQWMKVKAPSAWEACAGKELEDLPRGASDLMIKYLREAPATAAESKRESGGIDFNAGLPGRAKPVPNTADRSAASTESAGEGVRPAEAETVEDDEIPF